MKIINSFDLDLSNLPADGETRNFTITGDNDAEFILKIKNAGGNYYNFSTGLFQSTETDLKTSITSGSYTGSIVFPSTKTTDQVNGDFSGGATKIIMNGVVASNMAVGDRVTGNAVLNAAVVTVAALDPDGDNTREFSLSSSTAIDDDTILTFASEDQYDISLSALPGTEHAPYEEARFADGSLDINSSIGSNSL